MSNTDTLSLVHTLVVLQGSRERIKKSGAANFNSFPSAEINAPLVRCPQLGTFTRYLPPAIPLRELMQAWAVRPRGEMIAPLPSQKNGASVQKPNQRRYKAHHVLPRFVHPYNSWLVCQGFFCIARQITQWLHSLPKTKEPHLTMRLLVRGNVVAIAPHNICEMKWQPHNPYLPC